MSRVRRKNYSFHEREYEFWPRSCKKHVLIYIATLLSPFGNRRKHMPYGLWMRKKKLSWKFRCCILFLCRSHIWGDKMEKFGSVNIGRKQEPNWIYSWGCYLPSICYRGTFFGCLQGRHEKSYVGKSITVMLKKATLVWTGTSSSLHTALFSVQRSNVSANEQLSIATACPIWTSLLYDKWHNVITPN